MSTKFAPLVTVACGTCHLCCRKQAVHLNLEYGDDPRRYETTTQTTSTGEVVYFLKQKPNGDCIYLDDNGCTIHPNHPALCRVFDCAALYTRVPRAERKKLVAEGKLSQKVLDAGRERAKK